MYCDKCGISYECEPIINDDGQEICEMCDGEEDLDMDLAHAVKMYKLRTPDNRDDDDFIKHVFAQVSSGYMQKAEWWMCDENLLDLTYLSGTDSELRDVHLVCGTGGPHTWLDTEARMIYSRHGSVLAQRSIDSNTCNNIVDYYAELFESR